MESFAETIAPMRPICLLAYVISPPATSENGRRTDQTVLHLFAPGVPVILLLTATEQEARQLRSHADRHYPEVRIHTVAELLNDLPPEEDIPLWAFHFSAYWRSYRIAMALRKLCRARMAVSSSPTPREPALSRSSGGGCGRPARRRSIWVRLHGNWNSWRKMGG